MKRILLSFVLALSLAVASAQPFSLRGTVTDTAGRPLANATVQARSYTTTSDSLGRFSATLCDLRQGGSLYVWLNGYRPTTYTVRSTSDSVVTVRLEKGREHRPAPRPMVKGARDAGDVDALMEYRVAGAKEKRSAAIISSEAPDITFSAEGIEEVVVASSAKAENQVPAKANLLTAGEVNDFTKWKLWPGVLDSVFATYRTQWGYNPRRRYVAQLTSRQGMPIDNADVVLFDANNHALWRARTDNTGKAELWDDFFSTSANSDSANRYITFSYQGATTEVRHAVPFERGINAASIGTPCIARNGADIFFIVDATGSMSDEIAYLQAELSDIMRSVKQRQPKLQLRLGAMVYRDYCEDYLTRKSSLSADVEATVSFLEKQSAHAGGDYPEALDEALTEAIEHEQWDENALARIAFVVLDAPSHTFPEVLVRMEKQIRLAAERGIRVVPVACSDIQKDGEYLMRCIALATNGTYLFLTDDSGIGNAHIKPSTDKYEVELLNAAIARVIKQYTQMPDCADKRWAADYLKPEASDSFVPNPYDEKPEKKMAALSSSDIFKLFPNPCHDLLRVQLLRNGVQDIYVLDITGKAVQHHNGAIGGTVELNVGGLSAGIYFVKAYYGGRWFAGKFVKNSE